MKWYGLPRQACLPWSILEYHHSNAETSWQLSVTLLPVIILEQKNVMRSSVFIKFFKNVIFQDFILLTLNFSIQNLN